MSFKKLSFVVLHFKSSTYSSATRKKPPEDNHIFFCCLYFLHTVQQPTDRSNSTDKDDVLSTLPEFQIYYMQTTAMTRPLLCCCSDDNVFTHLWSSLTALDVFGGVWCYARFAVSILLYHQQLEDYYIRQSMENVECFSSGKILADALPITTAECWGFFFFFGLKGRFFHQNTKVRKSPGVCTTVTAKAFNWYIISPLRHVFCWNTCVYINRCFASVRYHYTYFSSNTYIAPH